MKKINSIVVLLLFTIVSWSQKNTVSHPIQNFQTRSSEQGIENIAEKPLLQQEKTTFCNDYVTIPSRVFEEYLSYIDSDQTVNGKICRNDLLKITSLWILDVNIRNLKGIEAMANLEDLRILNVPVSGTLDFSNNPKLYLLQLDETNIEKLNVKNNPLLTDLLLLNNPEIQNLDISKNPKLRDIYIGSMHGLLTINAQNGNNANIRRFYADDNDNLDCIQVDNVDYANQQDNNSSWRKEKYTEYSLLCDPILDVSGTFCKKYKSGVTLFWNALDQIDYYQIELNFQAERPKIVDVPWYTISYLVPSNKILEFWRIRAVSGGIFGNWSDLIKGCSEPTLSLKTTQSNDGLTVFPNPVSSSSISIKTSELIEDINILSFSGDLIYQSQENRPEIDVSDIDSGIYILNVKTRKHQYFEKIVIK